MTRQLPATLFRRALDGSPDAVVVVCEHGKMRYLNAAMLALSGYAQGDVRGQPLDKLMALAPDEQACEFLRRHLAAGTRGEPGGLRECALRHSTGNTIPVALSAADLGVLARRRYFAVFLLDLRARAAEQARTAALLKQLEQLEQQALTDPLTALPNRRAHDAELARVAARGRRHGTATAVGVADIDLFKQVNDHYGHPVGDLVLCEVGRAIERAARGTDFVARTGGEEFGMLFSDTSIEMARKVAERMRKAVAAASVTAPDGDTIGVTISIGLATLAPGGAADEALARADAALYQAKDRGRNRVETLAA